MTSPRPSRWTPHCTFLWWAPAVRADGVVRWPYGDYVLTGPESLSQVAHVGIIGDVLGRRTRFEELSPEELRIETQGTWPPPLVDMLLDAWAAPMGRPAFVTSTVSEILGSAPRTFRRWVADHATALAEDPPPD